MLRPLVRLLPALVAVGLVATPGVSTGSTTLAASTTPAGPARVAGRTLTHTRQVVVRPVNATGHAVPGFTVRRETGQGAVDCDGQSAYSVSDHVDTCYPSALYAPSCWKAVDHTVLCLQDVERKRLVRFRYEGRFVAAPAMRPNERSPQGLRLADGERCTVRVGGAWGQAPGHPDWVGYYSCTNGSVYGPFDGSAGRPYGDGISRTNPVWSVHLLRNDGSIVVRKVTRATYVGTAG